MADQIVIPLTAVLAAAGVAGAGIATVWGFVVKPQIQTLRDRVSSLEGHVTAWQERWANEVQRSAKMAARPRRPEEPPPSELPRPDWAEDTAVRNVRALIERTVLDEELQRYSESTPPRPRVPSRPR